MPLAEHPQQAVAATVVVPIYNARKTIGRCLAALCDQDCHETYEVLAIDSSDDGTDELIRERFPEVRLVRFEQRTLPGKGRNRGAREAAGDVVLFTDADVVVSRGWVRLHLRRQEDWDVVGGAVANANPGSLVGWASFLSEFNGFTPSRRLVASRNLITANASYKRRVLEDVSFPEDLFPGEDRVFNWHVTRRWSSCLDGTIVVGHINRTRLGDFLRHQARLGAAAVAAWGRIEAPASVLLERPALAFPAAFVRAGLAPFRLLRDTPRLLLPFVVVFPLVLAGSLAWARAFYRQTRSTR